MTRNRSTPERRQKDFRNRRALYEYHILEKIEAGIELRGSEIKSIRDGNISLAESYARIDGDEVFLVGCTIAEYRNASWTNHDPQRRRKLLLHRKEIRKIRAKIEEKGLTLVPLRLYFNRRGFAKVELGIGRGKKLHDKRETIRKRDTERELRRQLADR